MPGSKSNGETPQQMLLVPQSQSTLEWPLPITVKCNSPAPLPLREMFSVVQLMCSRAPHGIRLSLDAA